MEINPTAAKHRPESRFTLGPAHIDNSKKNNPNASPFQFIFSPPRVIHTYFHEDTIWFSSEEQNSLKCLSFIHPPSLSSLRTEK